jgi:hypothetical protein
MDDAHLIKFPVADPLPASPNTPGKNEIIMQIINGVFGGGVPIGDGGGQGLNQNRICSILNAVKHLHW